MVHFNLVDRQPWNSSAFGRWFIPTVSILSTPRWELCNLNFNSTTGWLRDDRTQSQKLFRDTGAFNTQAWRVHRWIWDFVAIKIQNHAITRHLVIKIGNAFTRNILKIQHVWFRFLGNTWFQSATQCSFNHPTVNTKFLIHFKLRYPIFVNTFHCTGQANTVPNANNIHVIGSCLGQEQRFHPLGWSFLSRFCTNKCQNWFSKTSDPAIILTSTHCLKRCGATFRHKAVQQPTCMHKAPGKQRMRHRKWHTKLQLQVVNQCHCLLPDPVHRIFNPRIASRITNPAILQQCFQTQFLPSCLQQALHLHQNGLSITTQHDFRIPKKLQNFHQLPTHEMHISSQWNRNCKHTSWMTVIHIQHRLLVLRCDNASQTRQNRWISSSEREIKTQHRMFATC